MDKFPLDLSGNQIANKSFYNCDMANFCLVLKKGKLYTCPTIPNINHFNKHFRKNFQVTERDYIDIYKAQDVDEIFDFLCKPVPFCRYCNIGKKERGTIEWRPSRKEISEWT